MCEGTLLSVLIKSIFVIFVINNILLQFQKAMKQQNIDFKDIDKDVLGTENEFKVPPSEGSS